MLLRGLFPLVLVALVYPREADGQDSGCGTPKQQTGLSGTFSSINYPSRYRNGAQCTWVITVKPRWRIRIHFNSPFGFESHANCAFDYVRLSEEVTSTISIGKYCNGPPTNDVMSQDNDIVVVFKSDGSTTDIGFSIQWTAVEPEVSGCGSRYKLSGTSGSISSMNYPNTYPNNADCSWVITVPAGMRVRLDFEKKFEIEPGPQHSCSFDNVVVRQINAAGVAGRSYVLLVSNVNNIAVYFKSDSTATFAGFSIRWKAIYACGSPESPRNGTVSLSDEDKVNSKATYSCNVGFKLVGRNRQCQTSGRWTGDPPKCQEILCPPPPVPAYGTMSLTNGYRVNSNATYTCNDGFKLSGGIHRRCLKSGLWSGKTPSCQEIHCGTPDKPANGSMYMSDGDRMNSKATYNCDDDYQLNGNSVRECLSTGTWSGETPTCQEIHCEYPVVPANGSVSLSDEDNYSSTATYTCDDGFQLKGDGVRECRSTGNWSGETPICQETRCGSPGLVADGSVDVSDENKIGSKATYTCGDGFKLIGTSERQCLRTGNWSSDIPVCETIRCGAPPLLVNDNVSLSDDDKIGSKATYTCDNSFKLIGTPERRCLKTGNWSGETPICQEILCGSPGAPANASVFLSDGDRMTSKAMYTCDDGLLLDGEGVRECLKTGNWSGEVPTCQEILCGSPGAPANASVFLSDGDRMTSKAMYTCDDGLLLDGEGVRECLKTGNWSGEVPTCKEIRCGFPSVPPNYSLTLSDGDRMNSIAVYTCDSGYKMIGHPERQCLRTGKWSGEMAVCEEIRCGSLPSLLDGNVSLSIDDKIGSKATYICDNSFKLIGTPERQCLRTGNWSGDTPVCEEIRCGYPPLLVDGRMSLSKEDKIGSKTTYTCDDDFKLIGTPERLCLGTGTWSGDMQVCEEIRCGSLPLIVDGRMSLSKANKIGSKATYTCDDDFKLIGTPERQCLRTGTWSGDMPVCEEIRCGSLPLIVDGRMSLSKANKIGSKATYTCDDDFKLIGTPERQCLGTGNWGGVMPVCEEIRCGSMPLPVDGSVSLSNQDKIGSKVTYSCNDGFKLIGRPERRCLRTGNWSGDRPSCQEIRCGPLEPPAHGKVSLSDQDKWNSQATYVCTVGYRMVGKTERLCLATWKWSGTTPSCQEIRCGNPEVPAGCTASLSDEDRIRSRLTYSCKKWSNLEKTERLCLGTGEWSGTAPNNQGKEDPRGGVSLPSKPKVGPASWSSSPYIDAYLCTGIVFNIVFLTLGIFGTFYGVYRILKWRRGLKKDSQKLSSFNFDNPAFSCVKERETQIAVE
ncbi:CUB and sushi domain-containing protein 3-like [Lineus longissimus]|uniref:CUB and sushi domain-containing protein 3-like n=1 Tax=Lineus longissimus TaxID=88925 RepID=UPI00315DFBBF